ncbi:MAG: class I SAM-dependent methyltransferase [Anaeromyxobacteraceae bacterium]
MKVALSRLPVPYAWWAKLSLFRHGAMDQHSYALRVYREHLGRAGAGRKVRSVLELGPGDTAFSAVIGRALGVERSVLVDAGAFASRDVELYRELARHLEEQGSGRVDLLDARTLEDVLAACGATYLVSGLESLRQVESGSVDLVFSQAVLEHVPRAEFDAMMGELRRVLRPDGVASHRVDLQDHLGGGLANLRFSSALWEADGFARRSGFYTNRLRFSEHLRAYDRAGFEATLLRVDRFERPALAPGAVHADLGDFTAEELSVSGFDVLLRPRAA